MFTYRRKLQKEHFCLLLVMVWSTFEVFIFSSSSYITMCLLPPIIFHFAFILPTLFVFFSVLCAHLIVVFDDCYFLFVWYLGTRFIVLQTWWWLTTEIIVHNPISNNHILIKACQSRSFELQEHTISGIYSDSGCLAKRIWILREIDWEI